MMSRWQSWLARWFSLIFITHIGIHKASFQEWDGGQLFSSLPCGHHMCVTICALNSNISFIYLEYNFDICQPNMQSSCHHVIIPPSNGGVYWFHSVRPSVCPSDVGRSVVILKDQLYWRQSSGIDGNYRSRKITTRRWLHKYVRAECCASSFTWYLYQICNTDVRHPVSAL